jgi:predicted acylesterase/phospholipase RssA
MTTQEALATYGKVSRRVFGFKNRKPSPECQFKASTLADAVREIVEQRGRGDVLLDPLASQRKGKAFVCASDTADLDVVQLFRTYETRDGTDEWLKDCKIWEAARATTAAPTFFKPIEITGDEVKGTFMDGAVSCNNPADKLLEEAGRVFNSRRKVGVILSLGTGTKSKSMPTGASTLGFVGGLLKMLKNQAVDTERVHHALRSKFEQSPNTYFRFNVPGGGKVGLAEWDKMGALINLTEDYLKDPAVVEEIEAIADVLARKATSGITVARVCELSLRPLMQNRRLTTPKLVLHGTIPILRHVVPDPWDPRARSSWAGETFSKKWTTSSHLASKAPGGAVSFSCVAWEARVKRRSP